MLVLGGGTGAFLSTIRSLGRKGLVVDIAWDSPRSPSSRSRYVHATHDLPQPGGSDDWLEAIETLLVREKYDLVIATNEQTVRPLHNARARLEPLSRLGLHDADVVDIVFNKYRSSELAENLGIPTPASRVVNSQADLLNAASELGLPLVLKPFFSFAEAEWHTRREVRKIESAEELRETAELLLLEAPLLAQENFIGVGVGVNLISWNGKILYAFQHQRVHQPARGGASSYRKSVPLDNELVDASAKLVAALKYSGIMMVEFLVRRNRGRPGASDPPSIDEFRFVEINARFWGSLPLALAAGADFPWFLYQMLVEGRREFTPGYRENVFCRNLIGDLKWARQNLAVDHRDTSLSTVPWLQVLREFSNLLMLRESNDTIVFDDPRPAVSELFSYVGRNVDSRSAQVARGIVSLGPVRKRLLKRLNDAIPAARRVMFVCHGNICRSPLAERLLDSIQGGRIVSTSSGVHAWPGRACPSTAIEAAAAMGIDLSHHRSQALTNELVETSDILFSFDESVHRELARQFPAARHKLHRFGLLDAAGPIDIADPIQLPRNVYDTVYSRIAKAVHAAWVSERPDKQD